LGKEASADHRDRATRINSKTVFDPSVLTEAELATEVPSPDVATLPPVGTPSSAAQASVIGNGTWIDEFQILSKLGQGAFATVYLARQETMRRLVALKLSSRGSDEPQALSRLDHSNIVRVYDQRCRTEDPPELLYMEYVPGGTMADVLECLSKHDGKFGGGEQYFAAINDILLAAGQAPSEASTTRRWVESADWASTVAWLGCQIAQALDYAHRRGVLHRDVKPANILLTAEGIPKLADFNVSVGGEVEDADADENFGGSLAYMSPEQLQVFIAEDGTTAKDLDGRSDLYALAIVLCELWLGTRPWMVAPINQTTSQSLIDAQLQARKQRLNLMPTNQQNQATSRALANVLTTMLSFERSDRPSTGAEAAGKLRLAIYPQAAPLFHPQPTAFRTMLLRFPVWLTTGIVILVPNIVVGIFNFFYNKFHILDVYPTIRSTFIPLATTINLIAYPSGFLLLLFFSKPIAAGLKQALRGEPVSESSLDAAWQLGTRAAVIGGSLWTIAGLVYPAVLKFSHPEFTWPDALHFFLSLVVCGGVAWTLPFFLGSAAGVLLYYPKLVAPTMSDPSFEARSNHLRKIGGRYLLAAAMVPLLAAALSSSRDILLLTLAATAGGVAVSFIAYQAFEDTFAKLSIAIAKDSDQSPV
jgi:hypothetical protein